MAGQIGGVAYLNIPKSEYDRRLAAYHAQQELNTRANIANGIISASLYLIGHAMGKSKDVLRRLAAFGAAIDQTAQTFFKDGSEIRFEPETPRGHRTALQYERKSKD